MLKKYMLFLIGLILIISIGCQLTQYSAVENSPQPDSNADLTTQAQETTNEPKEQPAATPTKRLLLTQEQLLQPEDFTYLGAFRLPPDPEWEYSGQALTFNPAGDPNGKNDGFPGSLFAAGHDHRLLIAEITIPEPVISKDPEALPTAAFLQPFNDLLPNLFPPDQDLPRIGIEYLDGNLHYVHGQHFQDFEPSHGWANTDLKNPQPVGPYLFGSYTNYITSDYLFLIPETWSETNLPGYRLVAGRFREGVWGGGGPALLAYRTDNIINNQITEITPLLLFGTQEPGMTDITSAPEQHMVGYKEADHWWDGAWLTQGDRSAVVFVGTKAVGESWYGFSNGVRWDYDCAESNTCPQVPDWPHDNRGYWAEDYQAQLLFFDPNELAAVARGEMNTWEPQPYATLILDPDFFDPQINLEEYKTDLTGAMAFDEKNGLVYIFERLAVNYDSIVHVYRLNP